MAQSPLLRHPERPDSDGRIHHVTPANAGWTYVGFAVHELASGAVLSRPTAAEEVCLVLLSGRARISAGEGASKTDFGLVGERCSVFEGAPWSVYVPARSHWRVQAETAVELAVCAAPAEGRLPARLIPPSQVGEQVRGSRTNTRYVRNILPEDAPAESLLVVEVVTPGGHWSSYPPHKHDCDRLPHESLLEETYYHRLNPPQGFAFQRVYTDRRDLDETLCVADRDVVLVPRGYHPVGAPHGYDLYYLNVMAGPKRIWKFHNDPAHAWLAGSPDPAPSPSASARAGG
jgi:5-deoxy-glucuronate isomerase